MFFSAFAHGQEISSGQTESNKPLPEDPVYTTVEKMPSFPGGEQALTAYLIRSIRYPETEKSRNVSGTVYLSFIISRSGDINDIKLLRGVSDDIDKEAIRAVQAMPRWIPGEHKGKPVDVKFNLPVKFTPHNNVQKEEKSPDHVSGDDHYRNGLTAFNEGRYGEAVKELTEGIRNSASHDLNALFIRGCAYYNLNDSASACRDWKICHHRNDPRAVEKLVKHCGCFYDPEKKQVYFENAITEKENYEKRALTKENNSPRPGHLLYVRPDLMPRFPGGEQALKDFIKRNIIYPNHSLENNFTGTVHLTFVIDTTGNISRITVIKSASPDLDSEAIRVIKKMPAWECGRHNGKPVNVQYRLPIEFSLQ